MDIYRKLRDYIYDDSNFRTSIFGDIMSDWCIFVYKENDEWKEWTCRGIYCGEKDFLLDYYVRGIFPVYKIEQQERIVPYLRIILGKDNEK